MSLEFTFSCIKASSYNNLIKILLETLIIVCDKEVIFVMPLPLAMAGEGTLHRTETYKADFLSLVDSFQS